MDPSFLKRGWGDLQPCKPGKSLLWHANYWLNLHEYADSVKKVQVITKSENKTKIY